MVVTVEKSLKHYLGHGVTSLRALENELLHSCYAGFIDYELFFVLWCFSLGYFHIFEEVHIICINSTLHQIIKLI